VHPYLLYGIPVWSATFETNLKHFKFSKTKHQIIGGGKYYDRATPYFVKNNILKIREIYELEVAKVMFQLTHYNKPDFQMTILIIIFLIIVLQNCRKVLSIKV